MLYDIGASIIASVTYASGNINMWYDTVQVLKLCKAVEISDTNYRFISKKDSVSHIIFFPLTISFSRKYWKGTKLHC